MAAHSIASVTPGPGGGRLTGEPTRDKRRKTRPRPPQLVTRSSAVVQHFGGTVDKFTVDGIMAVFGAPAALEDHAFRACLAAVGIQAETAKLAKEAQARDGIALRLRVGLNSGQSPWPLPGPH